MKPAAVEKAGKAAEEAHKEAYGQEAEPPVEPVLEPVVVDEPPAEPPAEPIVAEEPPAEPPVEEDEEKVDWKHKYNTLQGMFNAEVPRLNNELRAAVEKISGLENIIATMNTPAEPAEPGAEPHLSEQDISDYGPEMVEFAKKAAMEALGPQLQQLEARNKALEQQNLQLQQSVGNVDTTNKKNARQHVFDELANNVPNWVQINDDPNFIAWLSEQDAFAGETRQALLNQAFGTNDAPRVVAFFKKYVDELNLVSGQGGNQPTDTTSPTVNMDTLVAPGKPQSSGAPVAEGNQSVTWTAAQIQEFYADVQRGKFKNDPAEKDRIEAEIVRAGNEGRVIQ